MSQATSEQKEKTLPLQRPLKLDRHKIHHSITVRRSPKEVYEFWRNFENLPRFLKDVVDVQVLSPTRSKWKIKLKSGLTAEWEAMITADEEGKKIAWESLADAEVETNGTVQFLKAPAGRGTIVVLSMNYEVPGGKLTEWGTFFTGEDPDTLTQINLKRLKAFLETGEFPTVEGQSSGRREEEQPHTTH